VYCLPGLASGYAPHSESAPPPQEAAQVGAPSDTPEPRFGGGFCRDS